MKSFYNTIIILSVLGFSSCGGSGEVGPSEPEPIPNPLAATLLFPEDRKECTEGVVQSDTQSNVTFRWTASENTDSYEIKLTNLNTNIASTNTSTTNEKEISLQRGTPYEWLVISKANSTNETATSAIFRFYNQGVGIENYAPFPAEAVSPKRGSTIESATTVNLQWTGEDIDNDIENYEILFDTISTPVSSLGISTSNTTNAVIANGTVYYWQVITTDRAKNKSKSEVFQFRVK